jgi:hypothetical protein
VPGDPERPDGDGEYKPGPDAARRVGYDAVSGWGTPVGTQLQQLLS